MCIYEGFRGMYILEKLGCMGGVIGEVEIGVDGSLFVLCTRLLVCWTARYGL